jgi:hypothetical protein
MLLVYGRLYGACLGRSASSILRSPWTLVLPIALFAALLLAATLLGQLGMVGGLLLGLAMDALLSCYFYFVSELVAGAKVRFDELKKSFGAYFWAVINLMFVVWLAELLLRGVTARNPHADVIDAMVRFAAFVLLNATPEVLYVRGTYGGLATFRGSIEFIHANWIEWFVPNLVLGAAFYFGVPALLAGGVPLPAVAVVAGLALHLVMVFRGHLFKELDGSSHRQRMFRWRTQQSDG